MWIGGSLSVVHRLRRQSIPSEIRFDTFLPAGEVVQWDLTISCEVGQANQV